MKGAREKEHVAMVKYNFQEKLEYIAETLERITENAQ